MTRLSNSHVIANVNEKSRIIGEIFVDDISELPSADGIDGYELVQGSVAYVIRSSELYVMDSTGKWYGTDSVELPENIVALHESQDENL